MKYFTIRNIDFLDDDFGFYWSDILGWTPNKDQATYYSPPEKAEMNLPNQGNWCPVILKVKS